MKVKRIHKVQKICSKCKQNKDVSDFNLHKRAKDGRQVWCKVCRKNDRTIKKEHITQYHKQYYQNNKEIIETQRKHNPAVKEYNREYCKKYYQLHKKEHNAYSLHRKKTDINYKISSILRNRVNKIIKRNQRSGSAVRDLGCSVEDLKIWLEQQFEPGMTWENYGQGEGKWNIDHIFPLSKADLTDRKQFLKVCHWFNLRPLWEKDNLAKGNKL